ncbi:hypothetical protein C8Q80DRAFT_598606 [Daedaleopsis nitida]|nr:hypothetical protein C8Q80DRAFT_598606 [Daedaleopsis nitida]
MLGSIVAPSPHVFQRVPRPPCTGTLLISPGAFRCRPLPQLHLQASVSGQRLRRTVLVIPRFRLVLRRVKAATGLQTCKAHSFVCGRRSGGVSRVLLGVFFFPLRILAAVGVVAVIIRRDELVCVAVFLILRCVSSIHIALGLRCIVGAQACNLRQQQLGWAFFAAVFVHPLIDNARSGCGGHSRAVWDNGGEWRIWDGERGFRSGCRCFFIHASTTRRTGCDNIARNPFDDAMIFLGLAGSGNREFVCSQSLDGRRPLVSWHGLRHV